MRFDWYQATIDAPEKEVLRAVSKLGGELRRSDSIARMYHYERGWEVLHLERGVMARVLSGGNGGRPHAMASGDATDAFVDLVRSCWPERHLVTRMDSAQDFHEEACYDRLRPFARRVAKRHKLAFPKYEDDIHASAGRTQYVGGAKSDYRVRLYEKGWEVVQKYLAAFKGLPADTADQITLITNTVTGELVRPQDWTRLEVQVRPRQEEGRRRAALASPEQAWAFTEWTRELADKAMGLCVERFFINTRKISKDDEALAWMCMHYGSHLMRMREVYGDWSSVGQRIGQVLRDGPRSLLKDV